MVYIVSKILSPSHVALQAFMNLPDIQAKFDFSTLDEIVEGLVPNAVKVTLNGVEAIIVGKVKDESRLDEALKIMNAWLFKFITFEGWECSIDVYYTFEEAGNIMGM